MKNDFSCRSTTIPSQNYKVKYQAKDGILSASSKLIVAFGNIQEREIGHNNKPSSVLKSGRSTNLQGKQGEGKITDC